MAKKSTKNLSIIDQELKIDGSISSSGKLIIRGQVTGTIDGDVVIIAKEGQVNSSATTVSSITIGGNFQGELSASKELIILSTGNCAGKVECQDLIVENGGILNAEVTCKNAARLTKNTHSMSSLADLKPEKQIEL